MAELNKTLKRTIDLANSVANEREETIAELRAEVERLKRLTEPVAMITESPFMVENITIDQRYKFEQTIARQAREAEVSKAVIEKLRDKLEEIRWSWANDAGRQCDNLAFEALAAIERAEGEKE